MAYHVVIFGAMITPYTNELYNELLKSGLNISYLACTEQETNRNWTNTFKPNYSHRVLRGWHLRLSSSRFAHINIGIMTALSEMKPDLLIISGFFPSMIIGVFWSMITGTKFGLTSDGWRHTMSQSIYHQIIRPWVLRRCSVVIACGVKGRDYFVEEGLSPEVVHVVPLNPAWSAPERIPDFRNRVFDILWCGHINNDVKNVNFFVDVCIELKKRISDLRVRIIGSGPEETVVFSRLAREKIEFKHDKSLPWNEMAKVYLESKILLFPSVWEAWGLVCNEALQCGVPCIVSPFVGAGDDLIKDGQTGYVVPLEATTWATKAEAVLRDSRLWSALSNSGLKRVRQNSIRNSSMAFLNAVEFAKNRW